MDFSPSPRIARVNAPSVEFVAQDVVDTLRKQEDTFRGQTENKLLNASGKESLGGGVLVGITVALQDTQIAFEGRTTPAQIGAVTTASSAPVADKIVLHDTSATFITNEVARGSLVINFTDHSIAEVYNVDSETQLTTRILENGSDNSFDVSDVYHIFNIEQCDISGGNIVAVDSVDSEISPILPTAFTQVVRTASSSATLSDQEAIQYSSYGGGVTIDASSFNSGTTYPVGTPQAPVNNLIDAHIISGERGFTTFFILGDIALDNNTTNFESDIFIGESQSKTTITINPIAEVTRAEFYNAEILGTLDGNAKLQDCLIHNLNYINGYVEQCVLAPGTILLGGNETAHFLDCWSGVPGEETPEIDMGGAGQSLALRNYSGGISLKNKTGTETVSIDMNSGQVILQNTITNGTIVVRGIGKLVDTNGDSIPTGTWNGGVTIINEIVSSKEIAGAVWDSQISEHTDTGTFGLQVGKKLLTLAKYLGLK
jgi:hypothetical protein